MNDNGVFRKKRVYFSQVSNEALRDTKLTLKAKGLYALIQSYITIENFILYKNTLKKNCKEGRDSFNAAWKELKDNGYLVQHKFKNKKGTFSYEYELLDIPCTEKPHTGNPHVEKPHTENLGDGKGGIYNNTNSNNTNSNNTKRKNKALSLSSIDKFFNSIKAEMLNQGLETAFNNFIKDLIIKQDGDIIVLETATDFIKTMVQNKFLELIGIHLKKYFEFEYIDVANTEKLQAKI